MRLKGFSKFDAVFFGLIFIMLGITLLMVFGLMDESHLDYLNFWWVILLPFVFMKVLFPSSKFTQWMYKDICFHKWVDITEMPAMESIPDGGQGYCTYNVTLQCRCCYDKKVVGSDMFGGMRLVDLDKDLVIKDLRDGEDILG